MLKKKLYRVINIKKKYTYILRQHREITWIESLSVPRITIRLILVAMKSEFYLPLLPRMENSFKAVGIQFREEGTGSHVHQAPTPPVFT